MPIRQQLQPLRAIWLMAILTLCCHISVCNAKLEPGASCGNAKDHCEAPKSGMGCCVSNSKCYSAKDCASFIKTCPFTDDTKKGLALADCMPDKSDFKAAACAPEAKAKIKSTDGKAVPLAANVTCYQSEKLTCQIYRNATGHSFISASCKEAAKKKSAAQSTWQHCLLLALLVASLAAVLGLPL